MTAFLRNANGFCFSNDASSSLSRPSGRKSSFPFGFSSSLLAAVKDSRFVSWWVASCCCRPFVKSQGLHDILGMSMTTKVADVGCEDSLEIFQVPFRVVVIIIALLCHFLHQFRMMVGQVVVVTRPKTVLQHLWRQGRGRRRRRGRG